MKHNHNNKALERDFAASLRKLNELQEEAASSVRSGTPIHAASKMLAETTGLPVEQCRKDIVAKL